MNEFSMVTVVQLDSYCEVTGFERWLLDGSLGVIAEAMERKLGREGGGDRE